MSVVEWAPNELGRRRNANNERAAGRGRYSDDRDQAQYVRRYLLGPKFLSNFSPTYSPTHAHTYIAMSPAAPNAARPNEPEVTVNGRPAVGLPATFGQVLAPQPFKEGSKVRLECRSSGGHPAPRIEWLNVTSAWPPGRPGQEAVQYEAMRFVHKSELGPVALASSVRITLTRYDLRSSFVCLVVPRRHLERDARDEDVMLKSRLFLLDGAYMESLAGTRVAGLWQKWLKLDVQVKPSGVRLLVVDVAANASLQPTNQQQQQQPVYSLTANRLYAIQCLVDDSRPRSQVTWFNRTQQLSVEQVAISSGELDYVTPSARDHRLTSFTRSRQHANGTTR